MNTSILFSGQTKNIYFVLCFMWLIHLGMLEEVHLEFLVSGHSYMPCDRCFGTLETSFKRKECINTPQEYREIINASTKSTSVTMGQEHLLDFKDLINSIQFRKGKDVKFSKARRIVLTSVDPWAMEIITATGTERVDLNKRSNKVDGVDQKSLQELVGSHTLKPKYEADKQITIGASKVDHLKKLRPFLSVNGRRWVDNVAVGQQTAGPRPRQDDRHTLPVPEPDEEPDDNLVTSNNADEYTAMPPPNFPPGYVDTHPPPAQSRPSTSSEPVPSCSNAPAPSTNSETPRRGRAKRKLSTETPSDKAVKRKKKN